VDATCRCLDGRVEQGIAWLHHPIRLVALLSALSSSVATAQETTGNLRGRVVSPPGSIAGAQIAATGPNLQGSRRAVSNRDGGFQLLTLPPGSYTLRIIAIGYRPLVVQDVPVQLGRTTGLGDVRLEPAAVELGEITVTAPRLTLDPVRTTVGATLEARDYEALPGERDYKSLIAILPHVNTSYHGDPVNVGGSTGLENMYFIDGVNVTSTRIANTGTSLPYNFIRAVEVKAGGYEAQYGKALGAVVNAVTYSGTNDFETEVFAFVTTSALAAEPKAEPSLREVSSVSYDVGARVGGPILRDRLWYSAAYNPLVDQVEKEIPGHGLFSDRRTAHLFAGKLTWQATPGVNVELSLFGDPTVHHQVETPTFAGPAPGATVLNPDPYLRRLESGGVTASLRTTMDLGARARLEGSLARSSGRQSSLAETEVGGTESAYVDFVTNEIGGGIVPVDEVEEGRTTASLWATITLGQHTVVAGAEYEDAQISVNHLTPGLGLIQRTAPDVFSVNSEAFAGPFHNGVPTAYVQDVWRITDRLTVNAGMRWSAQLLTQASGPIAQRFPNEWQPRLGFSWQLGGEGTHRVFGSYGRFYQQEPLNLPSAWYVDYYLIVKTYSADPRQPGAPLVDSSNYSTYEADWARQIDGLEVEHFDEFTLGYERLLGRKTRLTVRVIRRELRSAFLTGVDPSNPSSWVLGTPGEGAFSFLPPPKREYTALEFGVEGAWRRLRYRGSYVLSRTWGNYPGLFVSDFGYANPGIQAAFWTPAQAQNSAGLLPNDRPHVLKLVGDYRTMFGLTAGAFFTWQSGTPLNGFGSAPPFGVGTPAFLVPRGSTGRTPSIWDLALRIAYETPWPAKHSRFLLDLLQIGNPRQAVRQDEFRFRAFDANGMPIPNAEYLTPVAYQPPMTGRLGIEISF
jgi:hypothetical protein